PLLALAERFGQLEGGIRDWYTARTISRSARPFTAGRPAPPEGQRHVADPGAPLTQAPPVGRGWIVSPAFDLLFLANIGWLLLFLPDITPATTAVDFWQFYYLSLPHRWVPLVLVVADPDRREGRGWVLSAIAALAALLVVAAYFGTGAFLCLALADYV